MFNLLLNHLGEPFRKEIISLKRKGYKTEPAFAKLLGFKGDPYTAMLNIDKWKEETTYSDK